MFSRDASPAHYLDALATHPIIGRNFSEDEDRPHGPHTAILSYGLWHNTFGADTNIVGQTIRLKGDPYTVIGVLPEGATTPLNADLYTPLCEPGRRARERTSLPSLVFVMAQPGRRRMPRSTARGPIVLTATS